MKNFEVTTEVSKVPAENLADFATFLQKTALESQKEAETLKTELDALKKVNDQLLALNQELQEEHENATSKATNPSFKLDKTTYFVVQPRFTYKRVEYTAEELCKNKALQKELIEIGFAGIVEQEG